MPALRNSTLTRPAICRKDANHSRPFQAIIDQQVTPTALRTGNDELKDLNNANTDNARPNHSTTTVTVSNGAAPSVQSHFTFVPPSSPKSTSSNSRKKDPSHIPRPRNAFILFRSYYAQSHPAAAEGHQNELSRQAAKAWRAMSDERKKKFRDQALEEKAQHKKMYPNYVYSPSGRKRAANKAKSGGKKISSVSRAVKKKALLSSSKSSSTSPSFEAASSELEFIPLPVSPRALRTPRAAAQRAAQKIFEIPSSSSSSPDLFSSVFEETPSPLPLLLPSFATGGGLTIITAGEADDFVPTEDIPVLDLSLTGPVLVEEQKILEPSLIPAPAPFHPHLDADTVLSEHSSAGFGYGFKSYLHPTVMYEALPIFVGLGVNDLIHNMFVSTPPPTPMSVTQTPPALYLPHPDESLSTGGYWMDSAFASSSAMAWTPNTFGDIELDSELDPVNRSATALDLNYENMDWDKIDAELDRMADEYFNFEIFPSPSDAEGQGKERAT